MRVQRFTAADTTQLENPGVLSEQLIWPGNSPDTALTVTRVTMQPGATTPRHAHAGSEQVWVVQQGTATLLLAEDATAPVQAGDVIRTPSGDTHGLINTGREPFVYLTATTPPIDLTDSYQTADRRQETP
jgi:quercetin dioxygenase-like cupin family protein